MNRAEKSFREYYKHKMKYGTPPPSKMSNEEMDFFEKFFGIVFGGALLVLVGYFVFFVTSLFTAAVITFVMENVVLVVGFFALLAALTIAVHLMGVASEKRGGG